MAVDAAASRHLRVTRVQQQIPIHKVLVSLGKRAAEGTGQIYCPNPQHPERRPSARLYEATNSIHCFKCGTTWDVVKVAAMIREISPDEALTWLERAFNLPPLNESAVDMVRSLVQGHVPASEMGAVMQRLRLAKRRMEKARYIKAWALFDLWRDGKLDIEEAQTVREMLDTWTREALAS